MLNSIRDFSPSGIPILSPSPFSPENGSTNIGSSVSLNWIEWKDLTPSYYDIQLSLYSDFAGATIYTITRPPYYRTNLKSNRKYYWRVRSHIGIYLSDWSEVYCFYTK
jgi:hypothetical protein